MYLYDIYRYESFKISQLKLKLKMHDKFAVSVFQHGCGGGGGFHATRQTMNCFDY